MFDNKDAALESFGEGVIVPIASIDMKGSLILTESRPRKTVISFSKFLEGNG
jgi:hypothetical protein